jgi:uncharacterized membrane protein YphA (DoxX/SURF4 family)
MLGSIADSPSAECANRAGPTRLATIIRALCLLIVAAAFLVSGAGKVIEPSAFRDRLIDQVGLPAVLALVVAASLPWLELVCGLCLALGYAVREAAVILAVLLIGFTAYSLTHLGDADCGCFVFPQWTMNTPAWWPPLRNVLLLACSVVVARR